MASPPAGSQAEQDALARFQEFFTNMTVERVKQQVDAVYAGNGYLYDTVALHHGLEKIRPYFIKTAERAQGVNVEILDIVTKEHDYYVKWLMDITWSAFKKGETTRSFGMSHIRLNAAGKVVLHYDFWDSTAGLWEHVPILGRMLRYAKRKAS